MKGRILLVDDDDSVRGFVEKGLSRKGYDVSTAVDAQSAIELLANQRFHVVLTDKNMPGTQHPDEGGLDVLKEVKAVDPACGVLIMTAYATVDSAIEAMRLGVFDYIKKPFVINEIMPKIERVIELQRSLNPEESIDSYNILRQKFLALFADQGGKKSEEAKRSFLEAMQATLDTVFRGRRGLEDIIMEQRDALNVIAGLATHFADIHDGTVEEKKLLAEIVKQSERRL